MRVEAAYSLVNRLWQPFCWHTLSFASTDGRRRHGRSDAPTAFLKGAFARDIPVKTPDYGHVCVEVAGGLNGGTESADLTPVVQKAEHDGHPRRGPVCIPRRSIPCEGNTFVTGASEPCYPPAVVYNGKTPPRETPFRCCSPF